MQENTEKCYSEVPFKHTNTPILSVLTEQLLQQGLHI